MAGTKRPGGGKRKPRPSNRSSQRGAGKDLRPVVVIPIMFSPEFLDLVVWSLSQQSHAIVAPVIADVTKQIEMFNLMNKAKAEAKQAE